MEKICLNCKWWGTEDDSLYDGFRDCNTSKFYDSVITWEGVNPSYTRPDFGCIHFKRKDK